MKKLKEINNLRMLNPQIIDLPRSPEKLRTPRKTIRPDDPPYLRDL